MVRHALGVLGVLAAFVLLLVSAAMNWRFGYSLGRTEFDSLIYGGASAAADCLKALVPFFFFGALRNRMWSQAAAAALVGVVVTVYSLTSALGHAALNRNDTAGQRRAEAQTYKTWVDDLRRAQEQLSWIPAHRPTATVRADIEVVKTQRLWKATEGCTLLEGKASREFCLKYQSLLGEMENGRQGDALEARIGEAQEKLSRASGTAAAIEADPQAAVLAKLLGIDPERVQLALTIFVAVLLEVGSGMGMYVAFSQWPLDETPDKRDHQDGPELLLLPAATEVADEPFRGERARTTAADVREFCKEMIMPHEGRSTAATAVYEAFHMWCARAGRTPIALPAFAADMAALGFRSSKQGQGVRFLGIALKRANAA